MVPKSDTYTICHHRFRFILRDKICTILQDIEWVKCFEVFSGEHLPGLGPLPTPSGMHTVHSVLEVPSPSFSESWIDCCRYVLMQFEVHASHSLLYSLLSVVTRSILLVVYILCFCDTLSVCHMMSEFCASHEHGRNVEHREKGWPNHQESVYTGH